MDQKELLRKILDAEECGDLFEQDEKKIRETFRTYAKMVHPDICKEKDAVEAFGKLNKLYEAALDKLSKGTWAKTAHLFSGKDLLLKKVLDISAFELGARYTGPDSIVWIFDSGKDRYYQQYLDMVKGMPWAVLSKDVWQKYYKRLPFIRNVNVFSGTMRKYVVIDKDPNEYPLDLFLKAYEKDLSGRDIAWMISRMIDLCCLLKVSRRRVLNGFVERNLYINPKEHTLALYGGWQYMVHEGDKMIGCPKEVYDRMSYRVRTDKLASFQTDIECVRSISQRMIDNGHDIPDDMRKWVEKGSCDDAIQEYTLWSEALDKAYGKRKFTVLTADADRIYSKK